MGVDTVSKIRDWRALSSAEKARLRRESVIDQVVGSMAMEGEPVSSAWIAHARERQAATHSYA